jgi:hypothetical protein
MSLANLRTHVRTSLKVRVIVSIDLLNLSSARLIDCGAPTIHKNIAKTSMDDVLLLSSNPYDWTKVLCNLLNNGLSTRNML